MRPGREAHRPRASCPQGRPDKFHDAARNPQVSGCRCPGCQLSLSTTAVDLVLWPTVRPEILYQTLWLPFDRYGEPALTAGLDTGARDEPALAVGAGTVSGSRGRDHYKSPSARASRCRPAFEVSAGSAGTRDTPRRGGAGSLPRPIRAGAIDRRVDIPTRRTVRCPLGGPQHPRRAGTSLPCSRRIGRRAPEPVKRFETLSYDAFCAASSPVRGSLIQAMVGSFSGSGRRWRNRPELGR